MSEYIINVADVELQPFPPELAPEGETAERFEARLGMVSRKIGAKKLGYNITAVPSGKRAFPFHNHRVNEEMFFVLDGSGEVRIGSNVYPLKQGDFVASPPGGPELAHQIINTGDTELRYLSVSTQETPEVAEYPDSGKFGLLAEFPGEKGGKIYRYIGREEQVTDYWEGE